MRAQTREGTTLPGPERQFDSGGASIRLEWFSAERPEPRPGVLMLHGADGLAGRGDQYRAGARRIAATGYPVGLLHYLDRTHERRASWATLMTHVGHWVETVRGAIDFMAGEPEVDGDRMGIVGISLGGMLGIATAGQDRRVRALVEYFAPFPPPLASMVGRLPPTLILHGARDPLVSVSHSHTLSELLKRQGAFHDLVVYPDEGHGFTGEAQRDADRRVAAFLVQHLGG